MPIITIVDDDLALQILAENLAYMGYDAKRLASAADAVRNMSSVLQSDLVVLDVIMERPEELGSSPISGNTTTGVISL